MNLGGKKTRHGRIHFNEPEQRIKIHARIQKPTWESLFIFIHGSIIGAFSPNLINDYFFFTRSATQIPLSPLEQLWFNYYSPSLIYVILFAIGFLIYRFTKRNAIAFFFLFSFIFVVSFILSLWRLGLTILNFTAIIAPYSFLFLMIFWRLDEKHEKIEIKRRNITWEYTFSFLLGNIYGVFLPSIIGDYLFFSRSASNIPLLPIEQIFYMLYAPSLAWILFLLLGSVIHNYTRMNAKIFAIIMIAGEILSMIASLFKLGFEVMNIILLIPPQITFIIVLWTNFYPELYVKAK